MGMVHSSHTDASAILSGRVAEYVPGAHGIENAPAADYSGLVGAGSVWSTAGDLHRFVQGVISGRLGETMRQGSVPMSVEKARGASSDGIDLETGFVGSPYSHDLEAA